MQRTDLLTNKLMECAFISHTTCFLTKCNI